MALFDKLFSTKRKLNDGNRGSRDRTRSCKITSEQVRLLLFKECDWKGRKLLFDSSTIEKIPNGKNAEIYAKQPGDLPYIIEMSKDCAYVYKGPAADASALGEMIFGAVALNYKGVSLKIHIMDEPRRLMCTKVFPVPYAKKSARDKRVSTNGSLGMGVSTNGSRGGMGSDSLLTNDSQPLVMSQHQTDESVSLSFSFDRGDSGFYGEHSPHSSMDSMYDYCAKFDVWDGKGSQEDVYSFHSPPGRELSACSNGSWQRRTFRDLSTRFDFGHQGTTTGTITPCYSQLYSNSSCSGTSASFDSAGASVASRRGKLGLALLITLNDASQIDAVGRCLEQSLRLRALVRRLRLAVLSAGAARGRFVATLAAAADDAALWLADFLCGPRVAPAWLAMATATRPTDVERHAENVLATLCAVLAQADTKQTNFFISTLLTHVLTHHLGWVTTVSPYDSSVDVKSAEAIRAGRPYNALWAQLADLCGGIGWPPRSARTVICGSKNTQFLNKVLLVLTYFIRCGNVHRSDFEFDCAPMKETKTLNVKDKDKSTFKRTMTKAKLEDMCMFDELKPNSSIEVCNVESSGLLSNRSDDTQECSARSSVNQLKRNPTIILPVQLSPDTSLSSSVSESEIEQKVLFVLGDDEKLVGLKNKSNGGKRVKKSSKIQNEPVSVDENSDNCERNCPRSAESPSRCCAEKYQHSKPIKHSGFKFEFDKYPQIVTNYMKSKNLEILDRHYIGKPGNLKLDNFQFDPMVVPPIQEERCEACYKCQIMDSMLQTPTNASELEFMSDMPGQAEPQYATQAIVKAETIEESVAPKTFVRKRKQNTVVVNVRKGRDDPQTATEATGVTTVLEFPMSKLTLLPELSQNAGSGYDSSLLGGVTDHYVPDLVLQGTLASPEVWEADLKKDLHLTTYLDKTSETPVQAVAIIGDTDKWLVRVSGASSGGMSTLVAAMLDALPHMRRANVPARQCLSFVEFKLREFCVLSKTLSEMLMSTDFCDMSTLTRSLNVDANDVPLLLAVATTHTPQLARRYGVSYR